MRCRLSASWFGNIRRATLWLMIVTGSLSLRSRSLKSRPAIIGTPSAAKNPGRHDAELAARIVFRRRANVTFGRELEAGAERASLAPRRQHAQSDAVYARQLDVRAASLLCRSPPPGRPSAHTTSPAR